MNRAQLTSGPDGSNVFCTYCYAQTKVYNSYDSKCNDANAIIAWNSRHEAAKPSEQPVERTSASDGRKRELDAITAESICADLMKACNGHPYAKIAWPHYLLHNAHYFIQKHQRELDRIVKELHYPECWDTMTYPTVYDALYESANCSECKPERESGELIKALKFLAPFELVSGDTIKRTSPHSTVNLNSNATWAVSAEGRSAHKVREAIMTINSALTDSGREA